GDCLATPGRQSRRPQCRGTCVCRTLSALRTLPTSPTIVRECLFDCAAVECLEIPVEFGLQENEPAPEPFEGDLTPRDFPVSALLGPVEVPPRSPSDIKPARGAADASAAVLLAREFRRRAVDHARRSMEVVDDHDLRSARLLPEECPDPPRCRGHARRIV